MERVSPSSSEIRVACEHRKAMPGHLLQTQSQPALRTRYTHIARAGDEHSKDEARYPLLVGEKAGT